MSRPLPSRSPPLAGHALVVTVVRGDTTRAEQVFVPGQIEQQLTVGSRGDWTIPGPGILPRHFRLRFEGGRLFAANGDAVLYVSERPMSEGWQGLDDGAELRFGFGMLRVSRQERRVPGPAALSARSRRLGWALGVAGALISSLALAGFIKTKHSAARTDKVRAPIARAAPSTTPLLASSPVESAPATSSAPPLAPSAADVAPEPAPQLKPRAAYPQNIANRPVPRTGDKPWLISSEWRAQHERQLRAAGRKSAQLVFLGDSITEGWGVAPAFREHFARYSPLNLGIAGDTTQNVLWRVEHGALDGTTPKAVVVLIGVNNLGGGFSAEDTADGVRATVAAVRSHLPATRVLLLAILPARQEPENPLRQRIRETNRLLEGLADPPHVEFHDLGSVLLDTDGRISALMTRDFLHPTLEGFKRLSSALAPLLEPVFVEPPAPQ